MRKAAQYAVCVSTDQGAHDCDPDVLVNNFIIGTLGFYSHHGACTLVIKK